MDSGEFEKRRTAAIKAIDATVDDRTIKIIDLVELLLKLNPSELIVLPGRFVVALQGLEPRSGESSTGSAACR